MAEDRRVQTPMASVDAAEWLASLPAADVAWIQGCAFQLMAIHEGVTEADLYAEFARRAAADPDANVVR
jgi:hypothetical protein